jgi:hypothetical protein
MPQVTMRARAEELRRRVEALPDEMKEWRERFEKAMNYNAHFSQLRDLGVLMQDGYLTPLQALQQGLTPALGIEAFRDKAAEVVDDIIAAQRTWEFFREKLELRFSPTFKKPLAVADTVAWDCHRPVLDRAADEGILDPTLLRSPPLTYLGAEFSPVTWARGTRPYDGRDYLLGKSTTPIPVIELPWDHVQNLWEFLSIHHEVGHDLDADLKVRPALRLALNFKLGGEGVANDRIVNWLAWLGEVFADLVALRLGGPAYIEMLLHLFLGPADKVVTPDDKDPHPTPYLRILKNIAYARTLLPGDAALTAHLDQLATRWTAIYGAQPQFKDYVDDFPHVFEALMATPFEELKDKTVQSLLPYTATDDGRIRYAADYLRTGQNAPEKGKTAPRLCISAARLAVTRAAADGADGLGERLRDINDRTYALIADNTPDVLRAGEGMSPRRRQHLVGFARAFGKAIAPRKE